MEQALVLLAIVIGLIIREIVVWARSRPIKVCNPDKDKHRMGDMAVSYWDTHFDRILDETKEIRASQSGTVTELREIKTILRERLS